MTQVELVIFDIAGTTLSDQGEVAKAFGAAMREYGYEISRQEVNPLMGYKKPEAIRILLERHEPDSGKITGELVFSIHDRFVSLMKDYYKTGAGVEPLPGTETVFAYLKDKGVKIGLDTGFSRDITQAILDRLGWEQRGIIQFTVASDEVPEGRPAPFMIRRIMDLAGVEDPGKVVKIGDTEVDIHEGINAGCRLSIGITTGAFTREALLEHRPTHVIDHLEELIPILEALN